ncbi:MAG: YdcF family protein [Oscillospiraceae bacterium]|nr:YdcF family protein [Oscillospiraceae bacterium]
METTVVVLIAMATAASWFLFTMFFIRDRSRYRNCYLLFTSLALTAVLAMALSGEHFADVFIYTGIAICVCLLIVPFFLIINGITMIKRESTHISHLLSLLLGIGILVGEFMTFIVFIGFAVSYTRDEFLRIRTTFAYRLAAAACFSIIYVCISFVIFMLYTLFLQIIPRRRDFDYVIIHGAGLIDGEKVSKLLSDRLDKAIQVYRKDPTPPKMIPSGGQGSDEKIPEALAMKEYLIAHGVPESDIIAEDRSTTTMENLQFSKDILDSFDGRKYTALVSSNYHVYRTLRYARKIGLKCTGIGSHVAFYYWPSALIREYIAIHAEKKHLIILALGCLLFDAFMMFLFFAT